MTIRKEISIIENLFHDSQRVDQNDMVVEQNKNDQLVSALINNHFGSGILLSSPTQKILFDSSDLDETQAALLDGQMFDGTGISPKYQPSDINLGNQLEVELTGSTVVGRFSVKVAIIGLDFNGNLQSDKFYFNKNGKKVTSKHYKRILAMFFNDFKGNNNYSRDFGGRIVIKEADSFQLSLDPVMISQCVEPDIFWRDFKTVKSGLTPISLEDAIQTGIGNDYSIDALDINIAGRTNKKLLPDDVVYQVGQKFKAKTNNIQKITLLLGAEEVEGAATDNKFDWDGDLVISIYPLQTTVSSQSSLLPSLAIDFDPSSVPLAQISYNQTTLRTAGYVLTDVLQPVDFVFGNTKVGSSQIEVDKYYAITLRRSGASASGTLLVGVGGDKTPDTRHTVFSGSWVDVTDEDLWFKIWTDAAKVSDGQAYDAGVGVSIQKTITDQETGSIIDNENRFYSFVTTGENVLNTAVVQATESGLDTVQDERTGNPVFTRKITKASMSFVTDASLVEIKNTSEPLVIGCVKDTNPKSNALIEKDQEIHGLAVGDTFNIVNPDADLLSNNLVGSILIPNINSGQAYKIVKVTLCTNIYGDVNGDGVIDDLDIQRVTELALFGYDTESPTTQNAINDGDVTTLEILRANVKNNTGITMVTNADVALITSYVNKSINAFPVGSTFTHLSLTVQNLVGRFDSYFDCDGFIRLDGGQGVNIITTPLALTDKELEYYGYANTPSIDSDVAFTNTPFSTVTYRIIPSAIWEDYLVHVSNDTKKVPASFTYPEKAADTCEVVAQTAICIDRNESNIQADPGRNDCFVPDNFIIGNGQILRPSGDFYKVDIEIGNIVLELPTTQFSEASVNIFDKFVADRGDGMTNGGYTAMKYADCSTVQPLDLINNKIKFSVSIQSFYTVIDGYTVEDGYDLVNDATIGVYIDPATGILKLSTKDIDYDNVLKSLVSRVQILVYLKKAGWNNEPIVVTTSEVEGLLS